MHAYGSLLLPLYLLMRTDLHLKGISAASAIVTVYGLVYCLLSYPTGMIADRFNRKVLLGIGLIGNALAIVAMGLTRNYQMLMVYGVFGGVFGALFHPAANALVPAHYPKSPGMAIGLLGVGSGIGFFAGPQYAGWRAQAATWHWGAIGDWQRLLVEAGLAGVIVGIVFLLVAREVHGHETVRSKSPLAPRLRMQIIRIAAVIGCRDFAGVATLSLSSIYLQKAHGLDAKQTGFILGAMMLLSVIVNPIIVYFSAGRRRLPTLAILLICGAFTVSTVPLWNVRFVLLILTVFMSFQLGSYAVSDAAMLERVPAQFRGRIVGLFLTIAGTFSSTAPFVMGWWTDRLHGSAAQAPAYLPMYVMLGVMMAVAAFASPLIAHLGPPQGAAIEPFSETMPATVETAL